MRIRQMFGLQLMMAAILVATVSIGLLVVASLAPLGLVRPFPEPPIKRSKVPWAQTRPISDPATLNRRADETDHAYFSRLATSVSAAIMHWWPHDDPAASRYTRVTFLQDYAVWSMSKFARWGNLQNYEFMSPGPALQRGFGFCSQKARAVFTILHDNGYQPSIMVHEQHVLIEVNDTVIDADYGIFIPLSLDDLKDRPYLVPFFYTNFPGERPLLTKVFSEGFYEHPDREAALSVLSFERQIRHFVWWARCLVGLG